MERWEYIKVAPFDLQEGVAAETQGRIRTDQPQGRIAIPPAAANPPAAKSREKASGPKNTVGSSTGKARPSAASDEKRVPRSPVDENSGGAAEKELLQRAEAGGFADAESQAESLDTAGLRDCCGAEADRAALVCSQFGVDVVRSGRGD